MDDCKEFEQNYENTKNNYKQFIQQLDKAINIDTKNYKVNFVYILVYFYIFYIYIYIILSI